jgi:predicted acylesterase/phospholipase RssA
MRARLKLVAICLLVAQGCSTTPERMPAVPLDLTEKAEIPGMPGVRYFAGGQMDSLTRLTLEGLRREQAYLAKQGHKGTFPPSHYLTISGGGDNGAYTAGLLNGWTAAGTRPEFKLVTGISTGALIAPFAFLGSKYDAELTTFYTKITAKDILEERSLVGGMMSDAMADNAPLLRMTRKSVNDEVLKAIAAEYAKGRFLLVATADLDARRPIIWDMGKIASLGTPEAADLFVRVMVASAALPGVFPPTMIEVEAGGRRYQEMHVDGGIMAQVFAYPVGIKASEVLAAAARKRTLYVIRNAKLDAEWASVQRSTMSIAGRAVASLISTQGVGDLYRIYATTQRDGLDFNLTFIPASFQVPHPAEFDNNYMRKLYDAGYEFGRNGGPWLKVPPGFIN